MSFPSNDNSKNKKKVYYDGSCPMCSVIIDKVDSSAKGGKFAMRDITKDALPEEFTREKVEKEIHLVDADGKIYKNAEAILKILEEYPAWKMWVWVGRLPGIRQLLPIGYNFIAANRHFLFGSMSRIYWVKIIVSLGFISGLLLSVKLWLSSRSYPLTPVMDVFPSLPHPFDLVLFIATLCALLAVILSSKPKSFIWGAVVLFSFLIFLDQSRLQPWVYQYMFMLAALGLFSWRSDDRSGKETTLNVCRFIVATIYFWSGLHKLNPEFVAGVYPWMIQPIAGLFPSVLQPIFEIFGLLIPFLEMGIGIGLLTKKFRNIAILGAVAMCVFVLTTIGPFGHNWNSVVWPWNIAMLLLVIVLFVRTKNLPLREILWVKDHAFQKIILVVFGLLPLFCFFNIWDSYLSWSLYSGTTNEALIALRGDVGERLPIPIRPYMGGGEGERMLMISTWAFDELNVPPYPETRIYKNVARDICQYASDPLQVTLFMRGRLSWFNRDGPQTFNCAQL